MTVEIAIIGGGLSGLALASALQEAGRSFELFEARDRIGGRIETAEHKGAQFDLGPAWFWPGQPRMAALVARLGLQRFDQQAEGDLIYEDEAGRVQRGRGYASMAGSWRMAGGFSALVDALAATLPAKRLRLGCPVTGLRDLGDAVALELADGKEARAQKVVLALPPRVASARLSFAPALPTETVQTMSQVPTWMAGQAKAVAIYPRLFWREAGLSGDAMSRRGPMVEIHDASPLTGGPFALFGFIGVPPQHRRDQTQLRAAIVDQLTRLFGPEAGEPEALILKDWATERFTATELDHQPLYAHPSYGLPPVLQGLWGGRLSFAGTEVAQEFGGYLEGALEAAEAALSAPSLV